MNFWTEAKKNINGLVPITTWLCTTNVYRAQNYCIWWVKRVSNYRRASCVLKPHIKYNNSINLVLNTYKMKEYQDGNHLKKEMEGRKINIQYFKKFFGLMSWPKDILPLDLLWSYVTKKDRLYLLYKENGGKVQKGYTKSINIVFSFIHWWNGHKSMFASRSKDAQKCFETLWRQTRHTLCEHRNNIL